MLLHSIVLRGFRCHSDASFAFAPGINVISGNNGSGKTTILEAAHFLATGNSFRTSRTSELLQHGASLFYLDTFFSKHDVEQRLRISYDGEQRRIVYNNTNYQTSSALLGLLQSVLLTPEDIALIRGSPSVRRQFLDLQIAQSDPLYVHHLSRYYRAMQHRNILLRKRSERTIETWEHEMAIAAAYLVPQRSQVVNELQRFCSPIHKEMSGGPFALTLQYRTQISAEDLKSCYIDQFRKLRSRESELGHTLTGPHKDDISVFLGDREARLFASEGQQRACVAALRLGEWERLQNQSGETPIMLVDDVGIGFDEERRTKLMDRLQRMGQVFVTTTENHFSFSNHIRLEN